MLVLQNLISYNKYSHFLTLYIAIKILISTDLLKYKAISDIAYYYTSLIN